MLTVLGVMALAIVIWGGLYRIGKALIGGDNSPFLADRSESGSPAWADRRVEFKVLKQYQDWNCRPVYEVQANDHREATRMIDGITYPGDVNWVATRTAPYRWTIHVEDFDNGYEAVDATRVMVSGYRPSRPLKRR
jgi:hypothetical protein